MNYGFEIDCWIENRMKIIIYTISYVDWVSILIDKTRNKQTNLKLIFLDSKKI